MQNLPYSIYINKRPIRIAFLVNPKQTAIKELDAIFEYNQHKWGGRFNPIIFTDGKTIEDTWWKFLRDIDPDVIKSLVPLQDDLLKKIDSLLSPYSVEVPREGSDNDKYLSVDISDEGISIFPTPNNITEISRSIMLEYNFVLFELDHALPETLKQFICRNFGICTRYIHMDKAIEKIQTKSFNISNTDNLQLALAELSSYNNRFIYPIQLCALPNTFPNVQYDHSREIFTVVVGDSIADIVYWWNRALLIPQSKRISLNQIWLSADIAKDAKIEPSLKSWLKRAADPGGSTNEEIQFVSFSLNNEELKEIAERLTKDVYIRKFTTVFADPQVPNFEKRYLDITSDKAMDLRRGTGDEEQVVLTEPEVTGKDIHGGYWMADVHIEFRPERYTNYRGKTLWWKLPSRNSLTHCLFPYKISRICLNGFPSVLLQQGDPRLRIHLPDDATLFGYLLVVKNIPARTADPRGKITHELFDRVQRSEKGRYLSGFLNMFSGLESAYQTFQERYWRKMFNLLSHQDPAADEEKEKITIAKLEKTKRAYGSNVLDNPESLKMLAKIILQLSKEQAASGKELPFERFVEEAKKELDDFNSLPEQKERQWGFKEEDIKRSMSSFIEMGILLMGVRPHCPTCGFANWYQINEAQQIVKCKGCESAYPLHPQEKWYYKLNSLVEAGCARHGLVPVILVLGQMSTSFESKESFIYQESLDIFEKDKDKHIGDIDIVCIQDGKFIIGEVKQSVDLFKKSDFEKIEKIALRARPNKIIFSSLYGTPNRIVQENIKSLRNRLSSLEIEVAWYPLHDFIFKPSPVR